MSTAPISVPEHPVRVGLGDASAAVAEARSADVSALSDDDLAQALAECEALAAQAAELSVAMIRAADDRDLGRRLGATSTPAWLQRWLRLRPGEAKARVDLAHRIRHAPHPDDDTDGGSGGVIDWAANVSGRPSRCGMPATGVVFRAGAVPAEHARVIATVMGKIPTHVDDDEIVDAEANLARWAGQFDPAALARLGNHMLHVFDVDTLADDEDADYRRRELRINSDTGTIRGRLDRESLALVRTALDPLAAPAPAADGAADPRSPRSGWPMPWSRCAAECSTTAAYHRRVAPVHT